jgi:hypothetical protein
MTHKIHSLAALLLLCIATAAQAQRDRDEYNRYAAPPRNTGSPLLVHLGYGAHLSAADMAQRFGQHSTLGGGFERITTSNMIVGIEGHYMFGQNVKEDPLSIIRSADGYIIGADQNLASVVLRQRGWYLGGMGGKLFVLNERNRAGIRVTASAGWLQHKIRIQDDTQSAVQVSGEYEKGYDRLTGGIALQQFVGWQHIGPTRRINWYAGLEFNEGFTNTRRDWDFAERRKLDQRRTDIRVGIRVGWTLALYPRAAESIEY